MKKDKAKRLECSTCKNSEKRTRKLSFTKEQMFYYCRVFNKKVERYHYCGSYEHKGGKDED
jgi:hypothetical protein